MRCAEFAVKRSMKMRYFGPSFSEYIPRRVRNGRKIHVFILLCAQNSRQSLCNVFFLDKKEISFINLLIRNHWNYSQPITVFSQLRAVSESSNIFWNHFKRDVGIFSNPETTDAGITVACCREFPKLYLSEIQINERNSITAE